MHQQPTPPVEVVRSPRRRRTGAAAVEGGRIVVRVPADLEPGEERQLVERLVDRALGRHRARAAGGDQALADRARRLADTYLGGLRPTSVRWSTRMRRQLGSCTPATGEIRISARLAHQPAWVLDYVLVHELAHLRERGHSARFHALVARYPSAERARGFLEGFSAGQLAAAADPLGPTVDDALANQGATGTTGACDDGATPGPPRGQAGV